MIISLLMYLGWRQKQLVEVYQVWLDGQQNAAVNSVTSLKSLSIHYTIHPVINTDQTHIKYRKQMDRTFNKWSQKRDMTSFTWRSF